jgi:protein-arginine kinase activator protein McsA
MPLFICGLCKKSFNRKYNYDRHLERKISCVLLSQSNDDQLIDKYIYMCDKCNMTFSKKSNLKRHQEVVCNDSKTEIQQIIKNELESSLVSIRNDVAEIKKRTPTLINNNLQIVCVQSNDNYLDRLTDRMGDFQQALEFIKDCALSSIQGDCRLIEKIYFEIPTTPPPIRKNGKKIEYRDEKGQIVIENGKKLCEILVNNLQNSYLKGSASLNGYFVSSSNIKMTGEYDVDSWNKHIYDLRDTKYQKTLLANINMPQF